MCWVQRRSRKGCALVLWHGGVHEGCLGLLSKTWQVAGVAPKGEP